MNTFPIIGAINFNRVREFANFLESGQDNFTVLICSEGGSEAAGRALAGMIDQQQKLGRKVTTMAHGCVESAAVLVFAAGTRRVMSKFCSIMVHETELSVDGNSSSIRKSAKELEASEKFWCSHLATLTGTEEAVWMKLHEKESQIYPDECLKLNLATELI